LKLSIRRQDLIANPCDMVQMPHYVPVNRRSGKFTESSKLASRTTVQTTYSILCFFM